jgi:tight adherence protein C
MNLISTPILTGLLLGAIIGAGLLLMWRGVQPAKPAIADVLRAAGQRHTPTPQGWWNQTLDLAARTGDGDTLTADLAVLGRTRTEFAIGRIQLCAALGGLPVVATALTATTTGTTWNPVVVAVCTVGGIVAAVGLSKATVASEAAGRRRGFTEELAAYLDVVAQLVAGGAGIDEALRNTLSSARVRRRSEWVELGELAKTARLNELDELVVCIQLCSSDGARIRASLQAKAKALRAKTASEQLAAANRASEYMGGPLIGMLLAFLAVVLAPALAQVLAIN